MSRPGQGRGGVIGAGAFVLLLASAAGEEVAVDYLGRIKPVLAERCYSCHGALKQKAGLRLDTAEAIRKGGKGGAIVDLVDPDASELLARLRHADPDERMPPEGKALDPKVIAEIRDFIAAGVPSVEGEKGDEDPREHWAFRRIERPVVPGGGNENPIDAFLGAKRAEAGLVERGRAERGIAIRRLYLDLVGLPPTLEQLHDEREWEAIVAELLESPQHGERWGRHWMDVWRYSDWYGLNAQLRNSQKHIWHWRDWIVESLNADKGYDRMIEEMLAGDELAPEDLETVRATGFLARNYYLFNRTSWLDNTIEHTGKAFLGLTMNCAKCHDHKYDPIEMRDYYRFRAIFEPHQVRLDQAGGETDFEKDGIPRAFDNHLEAPTWIHRRGNAKDPDQETVIEPGVPALFAGFAPEIEEVALPYTAWVPGARREVQEAHLAAAERTVEEARALLERVRETPTEEEPGTGDGPWLVEEEFEGPNKEIWDVRGDDWKFRDGALHKTEANRENNLAILREAHPRDFEVMCRYTLVGGTTFKSVGVRFDRVDNGRNQNQVYTSAHAPDPKLQVSHKVNGKDQYPPGGKVKWPLKVGDTHELRFAVKDRLLNAWVDGEFALAYQLPKRHADGQLAISGFDAVVAFDSFRMRALPEDAVLRKPGKEGLPGPKVAEEQLAKAEEALAAVKVTIAIDRARAAGEDEPKGSGDYRPLPASKKALETPEHKFEQYPHTWPEKSSGRRTMLAKWITSRENPLTARVAVNHVWMRHFGEPLVETVFDFGRRAKVPLHQDLLDYLAVELMESGWSLRHLHCLMVTSRAYRMSSTILGAEDAHARDRDNRHYWRMNPRRMESEVVRDSLLHLGGALDLTMGGPSLDPKEEGRRRSLYFRHSRDDKSAFLATFDHADHLRCYRRSESVMPQQALALSNSRLALEMAGKMAERLAGEGMEWEVFVPAAFETIVGREPDGEEEEACLAFAEELASEEGGGLPEERVRVRLVHAMLNLNDFVTIR